MSKHYLAVIELDVWADNDLEAARNAADRVRDMSNPIVYVLPVDGDLERFQSVDLVDEQVRIESPICVWRNARGS